MNYKKVIVLYDNEPYMVTRHKADKVNLSHPNGGKVIHKNVSVYDLREYGGNKERKLKGYRS